MNTAQRTELRVCTECPKAHFENCVRCFGFGLLARTDKDVPVTAEEAHADAEEQPDARACSVCNSTIEGLPEDVQ